MKPKYNLLNFFAVCLLILMAYGISGCEEYSDNEPLDIVKGEVDLQQDYYKSILKYPTLVSGSITNKSTQKVMSKVKVTAREENSKTTFSTVSKEDGSFSFYVEGKKTYIFYAVMEGFEKSYYANGTDTTFYIDNNSNFNAAIKMKVYDPTPKFKVSDISYVGLNYSASDISFNGTYLITNYKNSSYVRYLDFKGSVIQSNSFIYDTDFFGCEGSGILWAGKTNSSSLSKVDAKTGNLLNTISCKIPTTGLIDVEVYNNNFWLLGGKTIYKLSMTGELVSSIDLTKSISELDVKGIVQKNNYIYMLNYSRTDSQYTLYKIDPSTLKIVSKGYLPDSLANTSLNGLTFANNYFWMVNTSSYYLYKFTTVE